VFSEEKTKTKNKTESQEGLARQKSLKKARQRSFCFSSCFLHFCLALRLFLKICLKKIEK
jgi:hypothetical protein